MHHRHPVHEGWKIDSEPVEPYEGIPHAEYRAVAGWLGSEPIWQIIGKHGEIETVVYTFGRRVS